MCDRVSEPPGTTDPLGPCTLCRGCLGASANEPAPNRSQPLPACAQWGSPRTGGETPARSTSMPQGHIWVADKCGTTSCVGRTEHPIMEFDASGTLLKSFGSGLLASPHGIHVDGDGNVWVTDAPGPGVAGGTATSDKGQQVMKFSRDGKLLLTLGKAGVTGTDTGTFNQPADVAVAPNGDIFVADGHGNARIVKFSKDGRFISEWGRRGTGTGEFDVPHAIEFDSRGRLFVGDRGNSRIQIFDQNGQFLAEWRQFGRPSGIFIDRNDTIYVTDSSRIRNETGLPQRFRVGSAKDGSVAALSNSRAGSHPPPQECPEGIAASADGTITGRKRAPRREAIYARWSPPAFSRPLQHPR